jgi:hypothetical protein
MTIKFIKNTLEKKPVSTSVVVYLKLWQTFCCCKLKYAKLYFNEEILQLFITIPSCNGSKQKIKM